MKYAKKIVMVVFAMLMITGGLVLEASAQRRGGRAFVRPTVRPVIVRRHYYRDPFWRSRYYSGFYDPYYYSPYLQYRDQQAYLERDFAGNQRELSEHQRKYRADGVITPKEQRELEDDYKDVQNSRNRLRRFYGSNGRY